MRITILTYGSRGDVQPFVALALGLQKAGHKVRLAAPHRFTEFAALHGIPFVPLAGDPEEISLHLNDARSNVIRMVRSMKDYVFSIAEPVLRACFDACDDADLIVHSFLFTTGGHSLARKRGIPDVSVQGFPIFAPTSAFPNVALPNTPPGTLSYFTHWLATQIYWYGGNTYKLPDDIELKLYWPFDEPRSSQRSAQPTTPLLFAYSPVVLPRPADWSASYIHVTGYFFLDSLEVYQPPPDLADFLSAGEAPVCITFGSMVNREAGHIDAIVRQALARTGQRGIILTGWGGNRPAEPIGDLFYLEAAPHDWLFTRCKSVVHHGGAGTTAAGLRAGIPNIVLPHAADQMFWGKRVAVIGAGPEPIALKKLSVEKLVAAFIQADSEALQARARETGRLIRAENGVGEAVRLIETKSP
jgi:sterol 3beta-glucosyltransferase